MHIKKHVIIIFLLIFTLFLTIKSTTYASASYIEINTKIESYTIKDNSTNLTVFLNQTGDETAYNIEINPITSKQFLINNSIKKNSLIPGDTMQGNFTVLTNGTLLTGTYPLAIIITYNDVFNYPFSIVSNHIIKYKEEYESNIYGVISKLYIPEENSGELLLKIRNYDVSTHDVKITLYLPGELKCIKNEITAPVQAIEEQNVKFEIEPFGALKGSTYAVFASLEYEDESHHYTVFVETTITIAEKTQDEQKSYTLLFIMIAIFIALIIIYIVLRKKGRKN